MRSVALFGVSGGVCFSESWAEGEWGEVEEEVGVLLLLLLLWLSGVERGECADWRIGKGRILRGFKKLIYTGNNRSRWRSSRVAGVRCCCRRESSLFAPLFPWEKREREAGMEGGDGVMSVEADVFVGFQELRPSLEAKWFDVAD